MMCLPYLNHYLCRFMHSCAEATMGFFCFFSFLFSLIIIIIHIIIHIIIIIIIIIIGQNKYEDYGRR